MAEAANRLCPACGMRFDSSTCPVDGTAMVLTYRYNPNAIVQIGDVIAERYRITGILGRGGYGAVYSGVHLVTGSEIAVKVMKADFDGPDEATIRRFFREARVTAALSHPNTVRVFDVGQTRGGTFFIAMERLNGPSLEAVLQARFDAGKSLTQLETLDIAIPVLRALQEAHQHHLVHRDLKPANIVLADFGDGEPTVKLLDFGIALTAHSSLTTSGMALGTPAYMSPEQCEAIAIDGRSDLYSLAIIMYRCVSGDVPFHDLNPVAIMQAHLSTPPPALRQLARTPLSDGFVAAIDCALEKEREDRFDSAADMRKSLERLRDSQLHDTPVALPSVHEDATEKRPARRPSRVRHPRPSRAAVAAPSLTEPSLVERSMAATASHLPHDLPDAPPTVSAPAAIQPPMLRHRPPSVDKEDAASAVTNRREGRRTLVMGSIAPGAPPQVLQGSDAEKPGRV